MPRLPDSPHTPRPQEVRAAAMRADLPGVVARLTIANGIPPTTAEIVTWINAHRAPGERAVQRPWVDRQIWRAAADGALLREPRKSRTVRVPPTTDPPAAQEGTP